jgi:RimJ/RimL family protein N-acetyltransferase
VFPPFSPPAQPSPVDATRSPSPWIRKARAVDPDLDGFARHLVEHMAESGRGGAPHFAPSRSLARDEVRAAALGRWAKRLDEPFWGRAFLLCAGEQVVGHLELRGGRIPAEMHRATLGMGIGQAFVGQGHGRRLIQAAIAWARDEARLSWIDLGVFAHNERAHQLYQRLGFIEQGKREDAFRIDAGIAVTDIQMSLRLDGAGA